MATFDLRGLSEEQSRALRGFRRIYAGGAIVLSTVFVGIVADIAERGLLRASLLSIPLILYVVLSLTILLCVFMTWKLGAGPIELEVSPTGLRFDWPSGRSEHLRWEETAGSFVLRDYSENTLLAKYTNRLWELRRWNRPIISLSKSAYLAILDGARDHHLTIETPSASPWMIAGPCHEARIL